MKINFKKLVLKNVIPAILLVLGIVFHGYLATKYIAPFSYAHVGLFFIFFILTFVFWSLLEYFQKVTGMVMEESWIGRIIFVLGVLMMIYLYKSTGRI